MGSIRILNSEKFQLKSATKLMEDLDVLDESKNAVWNIIQNDIQNMSEFEILSDEDECDIVFINIKNKGIAVISVQGGYGMFQSVYLPLTGHSMKAVLDKEGMIHVFAVRDNRLWHVQEKAPHSRLFTAPEEVFFTHPSGFSRIEKLLLYQFTGEDGFILGVVSQVDNSSYWISYRQWEKCTNFDLIQSSFSSPILDFIGTNMNDLRLICLSDSYTSYSVVQRKNCFSYRLELQKKDKIRQIYPYGSSVFALLESADGTFPVEIRIDKTADKATGRALVKHGNYHSMSMHTDEEGKPYMALSGERLCYLRLEKNGEGYDTIEMMPLDKSCTLMSFNGNEKCQRIFYLLDDNKIHVLENQNNVTWIENTLDLPNEGEVRRVPCYSTEMTFLRPDNHLVPLQNIEVTLWAESRTYIETAQGIIKLDVDVNTTLHTDLNGKITFKQYTNGLDVPVVYASLAPEYCQIDEAIAISQFADIHSQLSGITSQQLLDAKQTDSMSGVIQPFLPDEHRNEKTASELAKGIQDLMKIQPQGNALSNGLCLLKRTQLNNVSRVVPNDGLPSWSLDFSSGAPIYTRLTKEEAQREVSLMKSRVKVSGNGFFSKIADFFRSVIKGFVSIVKIIVDGIKTVVNFILDGVEMIFEAVITVVQEVFHFVEMVFAAILIFFVTVFAWLASLFIWNDIVRTKRAIREGLKTIIELLPNHLTTIQSVFNKEIEEISARIDNSFDTVMEQLGADTTVCSYTENNVPPESEEMEYELSNNVLMDKFNIGLLQSHHISMDTLTLEIRKTGVLDEFMKLLTDFVEQIGNTTAFQEAKNFFQDAFSDLDKFLSSILCGILSVIKGIIHLILDGVNIVVTAAINIFNKLMELLWQVIDSEIKVPFFSSLYKVLTGDNLTILNFVSFVISLPVVLTYKILYRHSPFETDEKVALFIAEIRNLLSTNQNGNPLRSNMNPELFTVLSMISSGMLCLFNAVISFTSDIQKTKQVSLENLFDLLAVGAEIAWMAFSFPLLYDEKPTKYAYVAWAWFLFGAVVDTFVTFYYNGKYIDRANLGNMFQIMYGAAHMGVAIVGVTCEKEKTDGEKELSAVGFTGELIGSITELSKGLLLIPSKITRTIVGTIDIVGFASIPVCIVKS